MPQNGYEASKIFDTASLSQVLLQLYIWSNKIQIHRIFKLKALLVKIRLSLPAQANAHYSGRLQTDAQSKRFEIVSKLFRIISLKIHLQTKCSVACSTTNERKFFQ